MSGADTTATQTLRTTLWQRGFRCLPVQNAKRGDKTSGKVPLGGKWQLAAQEDPPQCIRLGAVSWALNTGILCNGLRAIDLDVDDPGLAGQLRALAITLLGATIVRTRANSPRCLLLYRAAEGEPAKLSLTGAEHSDTHACKVEVLGRGQQFVAYGGHWTGTELEWPDGGPGERDLASLPAVSEALIGGFLAAATPLIGAVPIEIARPKRERKGNGHDPEGPPTAELRDISAALALIPNAGAPDWESWNNTGLAIYAATEGSEAGWELWRDWSAKNPADDPDATLARWEHYATSPPDRTGAGKLFAMAGAASPGWRRPSSIRARQVNGPTARQEQPELPIQPPVQPPPGAPPGGPELPPGGGLDDEVPDGPIGPEPPTPPTGPRGGGNPRQPDGLPVITCQAGELPRMVRQAQEALMQAEAPLYQRGMLVQPVEQEYRAADDSVTHSAALVPLTAPALLNLMAASAIYEKWDGRVNGGRGGYVVCDPPDKLVQVVLNNRGGWPFRVVRGVLTCPTLRPDGSLLATPGYDPISRYYLMFPDGLELPEIPDKPTPGHAQDSLDRLDSLLESYPFVNAASRSVALAMLMTQVLRCAMPTSPLLAVSARAPGTGKSHLVDLCSTVAIGRPCPAMGTGKRDEETEKGINALLIAGVPGFSIDNVSRDLDTPTLNMATERPLITIRLFGVLETVEIENAVVIYMTGNNLAIIDEQGRRTLRCELDAGEERPERRKFTGDPIVTARKDRGRYIADVLTIARAYHVSQTELDVFPIGSYGKWSHFVREPLVWLGETDPAETMNETARDDPATIRLHTIVGEWFDKFGMDAKTLSEASNEASEELRAALREAFPARGNDGIDTTRWGYWMRKFAGRVANKMRFVKDDTKVHSAVRWKISLTPHDGRLG